MEKRTATSSSLSNQRQKMSHSFPQFKELSDDNIVSILAFIGDVPFELSVCTPRVILPCFVGSEDGQSTITSILPYVSKKIYSILKNSDYLWKLALERLVRNYPWRWKIGLQHFISEYSSYDVGVTRKNDSNCKVSDYPSGSDLVNESIRLLKICDDNLVYIDHIYVTDKSLHQRIFKWVVMKNMKITSPLFFMPGRTDIGERIALHFFEPRYRALIAEVMAPFPDVARRGGMIAATSSRASPCFIYANCMRLRLGATVTIVQVIQCCMYPDGTADVVLEPFAFARIERLRKRNNSGELFEGQVAILPSKDNLIISTA